jgi:hypothetical protein
MLRRPLCRPVRAACWQIVILPDHVTPSPQHNGATLIMTHDVERVLADIDADEQLRD